MKQNVNLSLLYEIRHDAFEKSRGAEQGEKFFELICLMCELNRLARKEGILAIAEVDIPSEIVLNNDIRQALDYFVETASSSDLTEFLTGQYWVKDLHGEDVLLYYMVISSVIKTQLGKNTRELEQFLISCLSDEGAEIYLEYKDHKQCSEKPAESSLV